MGQGPAHGARGAETGASADWPGKFGIVYAPIRTRLIGPGLRHTESGLPSRVIIHGRPLPALVSG